MNGFSVEPPTKGTKLAGRYRIEGLLGRGGMGAVLAATDESLNRPVAIKWLILDRGTAQARFIEEARAMARIDHPNVLGVLDIGVHDGSPFLILERLFGESLEARLRRGSMPLEELLSVFLEACAGVTAAHQEGILHRDLKPANLFLCRAANGEHLTTKVLDFGLAKVLGATPAARLSVTGMPLGTPHFMSPQQLRASEPSVGWDVYALGVTLYRGLTGRLPFDADGIAALVAQIETAKPASVRSWNPGVPRVLEALVARAMSRDESLRPSLSELVRGVEDTLETVRKGVSSGGWRADLAEVVSAHGGERAPASPELTPAPVPLPPVRTSHPASSAAKGPRSRLYLGLGCGFAFLFTAAVAVVTGVVLRSEGVSAPLSGSSYARASPFLSLERRPFLGPIHRSELTAQPLRQAREGDLLGWHDVNHRESPHACGIDWRGWCLYRQDSIPMPHLMIGLLTWRHGRAELTGNLYIQLPREDDPTRGGAGFESQALYVGRSGPAHITLNDFDGDGALHNDASVGADEAYPGGSLLTVNRLDLRTGDVSMSFANVPLYASGDAPSRPRCVLSGMIVARGYTHRWPAP